MLHWKNVNYISVTKPLTLLDPVVFSCTVYSWNRPLCPLCATVCSIHWRWWCGLRVWSVLISECFCPRPNVSTSFDLRCVCECVRAGVLSRPLRVMPVDRPPPQKEVCGTFASLRSMNEQSSLPNVDSDNKAVSFIQQVSSVVIIGARGSLTHPHSHTFTKRVKGTGRTEHSSVKLHVILLAIMSATRSTWLISQHDQLLIS